MAAFGAARARGRARLNPRNLVRRRLGRLRRRLGTATAIWVIMLTNTDDNTEAKIAYLNRTLTELLAEFDVADASARADLARYIRTVRDERDAL